MASYEIVWVDTFTATPLTGNPCAVFVDARGLHAPVMQAIAREMNGSQTAFVFPSDQADVGLRSFMPAGEIPLAGHPTIATVHALGEIARLPGDRDAITVQMPAGIVPVTVDRKPDGTQYVLTQPAAQFLSTRKRGDIAAALGLPKTDLLETVQPQVVSTGRAQLQVALASVAALDRIDVVRPLLFPAVRDYIGVHIFARAAGEFTLHARHFTDVGAVREDPFTGSATGAMAAYCARYGIIVREQYRVAQGTHMRRPGAADVCVRVQPPNASARITISGRAVTVLRGTLAF